MLALSDMGEGFGIQFHIYFFLSFYLLKNIIAYTVDLVNEALFEKRFPRALVKNAAYQIWSYNSFFPTIYLIFCRRYRVI